MTDLEASLRQFRPGRDRRGIVFVISDLLGRSPERAASALTQAVSWPAETHVIHVIHPTERKPALEGEFQLVDVETKEVRRMWLTKRETAQYAETFEAFVDGLGRHCVQRQMNYVTWMTDEPFEDMFLGLLSRGSALAGA